MDRIRFLTLALFAATATASAAHAQDLLVGEYFSNTIYRVAPNGTKTLFAQPSVPGGIRLDNFAFDNAGNLYATRLQGGTANANDANNGVIKVTPAGIVSNFATGYSGLPVGIAIDGTGNVYVGGLKTSSVRKYSPSGVDLGAFATVSSDTESVALDSAGNLFVASNSNGQIRRFSPTGLDLGLFGTATNAVSLALDASGNLFVGTTVGTIIKFSPTGTNLGVFATTAGASFDGLAVSPGGDLFATSFQASGNNVLRFSATGASLGPVASGIVSPIGLGFVPGSSASAPEPSAIALLALPVLLVTTRRLARRQPAA